MGRNIEEIVDPDFQKNSQAISAEKPDGEMGILVEEILVALHYPKPTTLSQVLNDVASWSAFNFVLDPSLNRNIQIFAPRKLSRMEAFSLFIASLEALELRAVHLDHSIVKIVPAGLGRIAI